MGSLSSPKMHYTPLDKAEWGSTESLEELQTPTKRNGFRWKTFLLSISIAIICVVTFFKHISISSAGIIRGISGRADASKLMNVFQPHKPVRVIPDSEDGDGCHEIVVLMEHRFGFSYGHPYVGKLPYTPSLVNWPSLLTLCGRRLRTAHMRV